MEQAMAYVCCPAEEKQGEGCRDTAGRFMNWGVCTQFGPRLGSAILDEGKRKINRHITGCPFDLQNRCRMDSGLWQRRLPEPMKYPNISTADRLHIICTTLDGLIKIKEKES